MKITETQLRRMIVETLLDEAPLVGDGIYRYDDGITVPEPDNPWEPEYGRASIAHAPSSSPEWINDARLLMKNTVDNWAIVTLARTDDNEGIVTSDKFKKWLASQRIPKGTKIIVIGNAPYDGDFSTAAWAIGHDIFGHTIQSMASVRDRTARFSSEVWYDYVKNFHNQLPAEMQLAHRGEVAVPLAVADFMPDIFAAVFLGIIGDEEITAIIDRIISGVAPAFKEADATMYRALLASVKSDVMSWIRSISTDNPHLIYPWKG